MTGVLDDLRQGVRALRRAPGFCALALLTLALGIGGTAAMFSVVYGVLFRPLPFAAPEQLVRVWQTTAGNEPARLVRLRGSSSTSSANRAAWPAPPATSAPSPASPWAASR